MNPNRAGSSYDPPSSSTPTDDIRDAETKSDQATDGSSGQATPTSGDSEDKSSDISFSMSRSGSFVSGDISYESSEEDPDAISFGFDKYPQNGEVETGEPNNKRNKRQSRRNGPVPRPRSPFEMEDDDDLFPPRSPIDPNNPIDAARAETNAIIDRLLNSCDEDFDEDDDFDPAVVKFGISSDEEEELNRRVDTTQPIDNFEESDDEEVKNLCSRQLTIDAPIDFSKKIARAAAMASTTKHHSHTPKRTASDESIAEMDGIEDEEEAIFFPPKAKTKKFKAKAPVIAACSAEQAFFLSAYHENRPSSSKAALEGITKKSEADSAADSVGPSTSSGLTRSTRSVTATQTSSQAIADSTVSSTTIPETDIRMAFAEVEQLFSEDNEKNRQIFSCPSPPPAFPGMFESGNTGNGTGKANPTSKRYTAKEKTEEEKAEEEAVNTEVVRVAINRKTHDDIDFERLFNRLCKKEDDPTTPSYDEYKKLLDDFYAKQKGCIEQQKRERELLQSQCVNQQQVHGKQLLRIDKKLPKVEQELPKIEQELPKVKEKLLRVEQKLSKEGQTGTSSQTNVFITPELKQPPIQLEAARVPITHQLAPHLRRIAKSYINTTELIRPENFLDGPSDDTEDPGYRELHNFYQLRKQLLRMFYLQQTQVELTKAHLMQMPYLLPFPSNAPEFTEEELNSVIEPVRRHLSYLRSQDQTGTYFIKCRLSLEQNRIKQSKSLDEQVLILTQMKEVFSDDPPHAAGCPLHPNNPSDNLGSE